MTARAPAPHLLDKQSTRASLAWFNWSLMARGVFDTICGGTTFIFVAFALTLGVPGESVARFTVAASLGCVFQMVALPLVSRITDRKRFIVRLGLIEPTVLVTAVLITPLLPQAYRIYVLTGAMFTAAAFLHMTRPVTDDWVASTIPGGIRGRYLGRRFQLFSVALIVAALGAGVAGDLVSGSALGLGLVIAVGAVFGMLAVGALSQAPMAKPSALSTVRLGDVPRVFADATFRRCLVGILCFHVPMFMAVPFYQVYYLTVLEMSKVTIAGVVVTYHVIKILAAGFIGPRVDRLGPRRVVLMAGPLFIVFYVLMAGAQPGFWWPVLLAWSLVAVGDAFAGVAFQHALFGAVPPTGARPVFFAVSNLMTMAAFAVGALVGEYALRSFSLLEVQIGPLRLGQYRLFFLMCGSVMMASVFSGLLLVGKRR